MEEDRRPRRVEARHQKVDIGRHAINRLVVWGEGSRGWEGWEGYTYCRDLGQV